jgi:DNA-binding transcriptional LysR family regulator
MAKENLNDLQAFVVVARERSFTRAAAQMGMSRSALSHAMLALEARLGVRLLTRTTRSVSTTEAGARLLDTVAPRLQEIEAELASSARCATSPPAPCALRHTTTPSTPCCGLGCCPCSGSTQTFGSNSASTTPFTDIASQRFDAGVRVGDRVDKDMVAVRIAPDMRMAVAASPAYLTGRPMPKRPADLTAHHCVNLRLPTRGNLYAWDFQKGKKAVNVKVDGQTVFNSTTLMLQAALDGMGFAYVPFDVVQPHIDAGRLVPVLEDWWPKFPGYHLYYANRRQIAPAWRW